MGVDCNIELPPNVQVNDVSKVLGAAAGLKAVGTVLGGYRNNDTWSCHVAGVGLDNSSVIGLVKISLNGKLADGEIYHYVLYHFEGHGGGRLLMPRSTAFWIAVGRKLVDFFGGKLIYQDHTPEEFYEVPAKSNELNSPQCGEEWQKFQERMLGVRAITQEELVACDEFAAYKLAELED